MSTHENTRRARRVPSLPTGNPITWDRSELAIVLLPTICILLGVGWLLYRMVQPSPPTNITIATGGPTGAYYGYGKRYAEILKRSGIHLEVKETAGSLENRKLLSDPNSNVDLAILQGEITNSRESPNIVSLGRVIVEPLWVFYRGRDQIEMLHQLAGRRIAVGPEGSGTRHFALELLKRNDLDATKATLVPITGKSAADALRAGDVDAMFLVMSPDSPTVQALIRDPTIKLMNFAQADAYVRLMPFLHRIVLPRGTIDLVRNLPDSDVAMVAPVAAVVARQSLHPAIEGLMVEAMREVHGPAGLFNTLGQFPVVADPEFNVPADVERYYKAGPSFLKRYLPFWVATFIERMLVLAVPLAGLMLPLAKGLPALYRWRVNRRLYYWYGRLKVLEQRIAADRSGNDVPAQRAEVEQIDTAVRGIPVPLGFSEEYYNLRSAIDLVRKRVFAHATAVHPNLT